MGTYHNPLRVRKLPAIITYSLVWYQFMLSELEDC